MIIFSRTVATVTCVSILFSNNSYIGQTTLITFVFFNIYNIETMEDSKNPLNGKRLKSKTNK